MASQLSPSKSMPFSLKVATSGSAGERFDEATPARTHLARLDLRQEVSTLTAVSCTSPASSACTPPARRPL